MEIAIESAGGAARRQFREQDAAAGAEGVLLLDACDPCLPVVYVNPAFETLTGFAAEDVVGLPWRALGGAGAPRAGSSRLRAAMQQSAPVEVELSDVRKDGTPWLSRVSLSPLHDASGAVRYFLILQRALPASRGVAAAGRRPLREAGKLEQISRTDPASGLLRYEQFAGILNRDLAIARRDRRPVSLIVLQIVEFDVYRRTFGAKAADSCVRMVSAQMTRTLRRAGDLCARHSDAVLVASVLGQEQPEAERLAERIADNVRGLKLHHPRASSGRYVAVASATTGGVPGPEDDAESLLGRALRGLGHRVQGGDGA